MNSLFHQFNKTDTKTNQLTSYSPKFKKECMCSIWKFCKTVGSIGLNNELFISFQRNQVPNTQIIDLERDLFLAIRYLRELVADLFLM